MAEELKPCPFCGGTEAFVERLDYSAAYVQCDSRIDEHSACLARGPVGVQDDDGEEIPGAAAAIRAWNAQAAARATPPSPSTAEDEMPPLPKIKCLVPGVYAYTEGQMIAYGQECARAAVEKERIERRPRVKLDPELKAALEEAAKTRSTVALLPDGEPVFINYGDQPEDTAHLCCTACGGSGHIDDMRPAADNELLAELDWCIKEGCNGPRSHEALVRARAALSANAADREAKERA